MQTKGVLLLIILLHCTTAVPTLQLPVAFRSRNLPGSKSDGDKTKSITTMTQSMDIIEENSPCDSVGFNSKFLNSEASTTIALFYVDQSNFMFIATDPYDAKYFGKLIFYTSKEFNRSKIYETNQIVEDDAGLVKVLKVDDKISLSLDGISPNYKESK